MVAKVLLVLCLVYIVGSSGQNAEDTPPSAPESTPPSEPASTPPSAPNNKATMTKAVNKTVGSLMELQAEKYAQANKTFGEQKELMDSVFEEGKKAVDSIPKDIFAAPNP